MTGPYLLKMVTVPNGAKAEKPGLHQKVKKIGIVFSNYRQLIISRLDPGKTTIIPGEISPK
jgi:hypothetical protein